MTQAQITALRAIATAIIETVKESGPLGASGGHMYAALMAHGCTLHQFEKEQGIRTISFMNGGLTPAESRANCELFRLKLALSDCQKERAENISAAKAWSV